MCVSLCEVTWPDIPCSDNSTCKICCVYLFRGFFSSLLIFLPREKWYIIGWTETRTINPGPCSVLQQLGDKLREKFVISVSRLKACCNMWIFPCAQDAEGGSRKVIPVSEVNIYVGELYPLTWGHKPINHLLYRSHLCSSELYMCVYSSAQMFVNTAEFSIFMHK